MEKKLIFEINLLPFCTKQLPAKFDIAIPPLIKFFYSPLNYFFGFAVCLLEGASDALMTMIKINKGERGNDKKK